MRDYGKVGTEPTEKFEKSLDELALEGALRKPHKMSNYALL